MVRGVFFVVEGPDGSGKTTATRRCVEALRAAGHKVAPNSPWRFPDRTTEIGKMIDAYLRSETELDDRALHLLFAANRWEMAGRIEKALESGQTVIADRYAYSGVAYSVAKGLDMEWCMAADRGLPAPDMVLYLDVPYEVIAGRKGFGKERYEHEEMQRKVVEVFEKLMSPSWKRIDANVGDVIAFARCLDQIMPCILQNETKPYPAPLWTEDVRKEGDKQ